MARQDEEDDPEVIQCNCEYLAACYGLQMLFFFLVGILAVLAAMSVTTAAIAGTERPMAAMLFGFALLSDAIGLTILTSRCLYCRAHKVVKPCQQLHLRNVPAYIGLALVTMSSAIAVASDALWGLVDFLDIAGAVLLFLAVPLSKPRGNYIDVEDEERPTDPQVPHAQEATGEPTGNDVNQPTGEPIFVEAVVVGQAGPT
ncbi:unnamed protein product [Symbiodinium natans]|uniref:Uncharacterized protein n=1 Tax=Symbiodinium natans TaxID=878477 RepID=A0A812TP04_9DINO|nr:unnamed protein product [Symbiodinium natans]